MVFTYDLDDMIIDDMIIDDVTVNSIWFFYYIKQTDSLLQWACTATDDRRRKNEVKTSVIH